MSKFRDPAKWKAEGLTRASTGFSIKKESISAPIPRVEDDDEFPIRTPGASIATPLGRTSLDKSIRFPTAPSPRRSALNISEPIESGRPNKTPSAGSDHTNGVIASQPEPSVLRRSIGSAHSNRSPEKPQRKKSTLRSVFGKLFGRKRKSTSPPARKTDSQDLRAQHRSVSSIKFFLCGNILTFRRIQVPCIINLLPLRMPKNDPHPYLSTSSIELYDHIPL